MFIIGEIAQDDYSPWFGVFTGQYVRFGTIGDEQTPAVGFSPLQYQYYHYAPNIDQVYLYIGGPYWCADELGVFCDAYSVVEYAWHCESSQHYL